jgi:hypothetical protein
LFEACSSGARIAGAAGKSHELLAFEGCASTGDAVGNIITSPTGPNTTQAIGRGQPRCRVSKVNSRLDDESRIRR